MPATEESESTGVQPAETQPESEPAERADLPLLGMHCAACANRIERALNKAEGVRQANVNFATTRATVHYDPQSTNLGKLREVVKGAGYDAIVPQAAAPNAEHHHGAHGSTHDVTSDVSEAETKAREAEYKSQKTKFIIALALTIPVAFTAMGSHLIPPLQQFLGG